MRIRNRGLYGYLPAFLVHNLGTKSVSLLIALVLWGIVLGSRNVEITKEVPLEIVTSSDVIASNEIPDRIAFRLSGPKAFIRGLLDRHEEPIRVNLEGTKPALMTYRFFSDSIRVPIGVKVLSINPTAILIKLEYVKRKEVPVRVEIRGAPPDGYVISKVEVRPEVVRIRGAESRLEGVSEIPSTPIDVSRATSTIEQEVGLELSKLNVQVESSLPKVRVEIDPAAGNFKIKNVDLHVQSSFAVKTSQKEVTVYVRASSKDLQSLDRSLIYATIDLKGRPKGSYLEPVKVVLPKNIRLVKVIPDHVRVTLW